MNSLFIIITIELFLRLNGLTFLKSNLDYFQTEASYWTSTNTLSASVATSQCGGTWLLGGDGVFGPGTTFARDYSSLPSHTQVYFSIYIWYIDLNQQTDLFDIYIDNTKIQSINSDDYSSFNPPSNLCGGTTKDFAGSRVDGKFSHSASTLNFKLVSRSNSAFSIGFRKLTLLFSTPTFPSTSTCQMQSSSYWLGTSCDCAEGKYDLAGAFGCTPCNANCKTCTGIGSGDCTSCPASHSFSGSTCFACDSSCLQCSAVGPTNCARCASDRFLYWNGTCLPSCVSPLKTSDEGEYHNCSLPCGSDYYFENSTCNSNCPLGNSFNGVSYGELKLCNFKCPGGSDYLYSNGSCIASCPYPFVEVVQGVERYCNFPCENSGDYLYENGSCSSGCNYPYVKSIEGVERYCNFTCGSNEYLYENGSCYGTCEYPFTSLTENTIENYCNFPCVSGSYLYENGSCYSGCDPTSFVKITEGVANYCNFTCGSGEYLCQNGSCYSACPDPFGIVTQGLESYCNFPCSISEYLYQNGSCYSDCASPPFFQIQQGVEKYCNFSCPGSEYLYENGSCHSTCPSPFNNITQGSENYCNFDCPDSEYLDQNGSCYSTCPSPFNNITQGSENYCNFPCKTSEYYLLNTGECVSSCPSPSNISIQGVEKYCSLPCATNEYYFIDTGKCVSTCKAPLEVTQLNRVQACKSAPSESSTKGSLGGAVQSIFTGSALIGGLLRPNNLNSAFMVALAKLLKYVQYLDIDFPQDIRDGLRQNGSASGFCITQMFSYDMPESLQNQLPRHTLPYYIEQSGVHSSYLVNHWSTMTTYLFLLMLGFAFALFEKVVSKSEWKGLSLIVTRLKVIFKWNFLLFAFFNTFDDLTFFAILELRTLHLDSFMSVLSFVVCLLMSSIAIFMLYKAWKVCNESLKKGNQVVDLNSGNNPSMIFYKKWEDFQVLYAGLKGDSKIKQYYLVIYTVRIILYFVVAGLLYDYPMVQTIHYLLWSIAMMYILLRKRPIVDCFGYIVGLTYETLVFIVNVCLVVLVGFSQTNHLSESMQWTLSKTVLVCNSLVYFFSSLFSWIYILTGLISAYKTTKKKGLNGKTAWLTVPVSPYSNPGMDFDGLTYETGENPVATEKDLIITLSYPKRARISRKSIVPMDMATTATEAKSSMRSILSVQWSSKNEVLQRDTPTSEMFSRREFGYGRQANDDSRGSFAGVSQQNGYQSNERPDPRLKIKPKEKALSLSIDEFMSKIDLNDGNDEERLKFGLSEFFSNDNISRVNSPLNSAKNQQLEGLLKIQGLENNIVGESSDENSIRNIRDHSPKSLLFQNNLQLPRRERGSLYATFLSSQFSSVARQRRPSMFSKDTSFARNNNFQEAVDNLENGGESLSFNNTTNQDIVSRRRSPRKEESNILLSILGTGPNN